MYPTNWPNFSDSINKPIMGWNVREAMLRTLTHDKYTVHTHLQQGPQKYFHADINQSEVEDSFQLASDWIKSARKNVHKSKAFRLLGFLL